MKNKIRINIWIDNMSIKKIKLIQRFEESKSMSQVICYFLEEYIRHLKKIGYWEELLKIEDIKNKRDEYLKKYPLKIMLSKDIDEDDICDE